MRSLCQEKLSRLLNLVRTTTDKSVICWWSQRSHRGHSFEINLTSALYNTGQHFSWSNIVIVKTNLPTYVLWPQNLVRTIPDKSINQCCSQMSHRIQSQVNQKLISSCSSYLVCFIYFCTLKNLFMIKSWARHCTPLSSIMINFWHFYSNQLAAVGSLYQTSILRSHPVHSWGGGQVRSTWQVKL